MRFPRECGLTSEDSLFIDAGREAQKLVYSVEGSNLSAIAMVGDID